MSSISSFSQHVSRVRVKQTDRVSLSSVTPARGVSCCVPRAGTFVSLLDAGCELHVLAESEADFWLDANEKSWITGEVVLRPCTLLNAHETSTEVSRSLLYFYQFPPYVCSADATGSEVAAGECGSHSDLPFRRSRRAEGDSKRRRRKAAGDDQRRAGSLVGDNRHRRAGSLRV